MRVSAARLDTFRRFFSFLFPVLMTQAAGWSGKMSHFSFSRGRLAWKESTAALTPDSARIFSAMFFAAADASGVKQRVMASARFWSLRSLCGMGFEPAPAAATMLAQKGWLAPCQG